MKHLKYVELDEEPIREVWQYGVNVGDDFVDYETRKEAPTFAELVEDIPEKDAAELNFILENGQKEEF